MVAGARAVMGRGVGVRGRAGRGGRLEAVHVRAAVGGVHAVGEADDLVVVLVGAPAHGHVDDDVLALLAHDDARLVRVRQQRRLLLADERDVLLEPAQVAALLHARPAALALASAHLAPVDERDVEAGVEEGLLVEARRQRLEAQLARRSEDRRVGQEGDRRAARAPAAALEQRLGAHVAQHDPLGERHRVPLPAARHLHLQPLAQRVHHRDAHPVQPCAHLVPCVLPAELAARVQDGEHRLERRAARLLVQVARDPAPVVLHGHPAVGVQLHLDRRRVPRKRLVHRVIHDLVDEVVQPTGTCRSYVHARPLAHRLETLEHGDLLSTVILRHALVRHCACGASVPPPWPATLADPPCLQRIEREGRARAG